MKSYRTVSGEGNSQPPTSSEELYVPGPGACVKRWRGRDMSETDDAQPMYGDPKGMDTYSKSRKI